ncbi:MAG: valine--tRNA ligase [Mariprofundales bacterium]|nr:valine--tRNA ligase [Mariprofundales bacterium]
MNLEKRYDPQAIESVISAEWLASDAYCPKPGDDSYCIVIPPPNVTGSLHMGHAFTFTLQDSLIRWQRMRGRATLWQPGTDHAGIATQMVVERLLDSEGVHRREMGRELFLERVWQWKEESGGTIVNQLKRLGASCDWSRERFTMDDGLSEAVREVFVRLHDEGLIYRGKRLVNWDPVLETALSDLEVVHKEEEGSLWYISYPLVDDSSTKVVVATTRPETMFGDAAVAVHPQDERYVDLIGRRVRLPLTERTIPIVADDYVDRDFGTGCVKITPAHDFNDYEVGKRHDLPMINTLTPRAEMLACEAVPRCYHGLERYQARRQVVADLTAAGLIHKIEEHLHQVGYGDRSHAVLEPYLTDQWYVDIKPLAKPAIAAVESGDIRFVPQHWEKTYFEWMRNIQDWCISRQLWWGHRIPAWYCDSCDHITVAREDPVRCAGCGGSQIRQDEDVLDTWFSSALWPFSTLGWPHDSAEMRSFYPTNVLVTGFDIIFFWVARMIMMGLKFTGEVPFHDVYIHALIRDAQGQKMSKSKGNVIDPLLMVERYGADAMRFTLAHMATPGRDIKLDESRIESNRNFMNKIWNAARFVFMNRGDAVVDYRLRPTQDINRWLLTELEGCRSGVDDALTSYRFNDAATALYNFIWGSYCDWFVEAAKVALYGDDAAAKEETQVVMLTALDGWLRLLHPLCPFITETLWRQLHGGERLLVTAEWMPHLCVDGAAAARIEQMMEVVSAIRSIRGEMGVAPGRAVAITVAATDEVRLHLQGCQTLMHSLARLESVEWVDSEAEIESAAVAPLGFAKVMIPIAGLVDVQEELARLDKALVKINRDVERMEVKLANPKFCANAPPDIVSRVKQELQEAVAKRSEIVAARDRFA